MNRLSRLVRLGLIASVLVALVPVSLSGREDMVNGENYTGSISAPGEVDIYTFQATAGDSIIVSVGELGATAFSPWIRLFRPDNTQIGSHFGALVGQIDITAAPATGTYTIWVADSASTQIGNYTLTLAKTGTFVVPGGDHGGPLTNGSNQSGIIHVGDLDMWSFDATAGDSVILHIGEIGTTGDFRPWMRLKGPAGQNVAQAFNIAAAQIEVNVAATGSYTVVVGSGDTGLDDTGSYTLTLAKTGAAITISPGDEGGPLTNGANHTGHIFVGDADAWTFSATAGDRIILHIGEVGTTGDFRPWMRLKGPTGADVAEHFQVAAAIIEVVAPSTGSYTLVVASGDPSVDEVGDYTLTLAKSGSAISISPGDEGGPMTNGSNHTGHIHVGDADVWTFSATAGDAVILHIGEVGTTGDFRPWIRLVGPTGIEAGDNFQIAATWIEANVTVTGTYMVVVASADPTFFDEIGDYTLTLAKSGSPITISPGDEGGPMTNGSNHTGHIHVGDADAWTFSATAGDSVVLHIGEVGTTGDFRPWMRLKGPTGIDVGEAFQITAAQLDVHVAVTGSYTLVIASADPTFVDEVGDYTVTLIKTGALTISPGDQGGPMTNGSNHTGHIFPGDADSWTFSATAGDSIILHIGEVGTTGDFRPWIRIKGPTGVDVGDAFNVAAAYIEVNAALTGAYTVIVASGDPAFFDEAGDYTLTLSKTGVPFTISGGDEGGSIVNGGVVSGIIHVGDLDMWSFQASAGEALTIRVSDSNLDANFVPWIRVKGPNGQDLGDAFSATVSEFTGTAPVTGTYIISVASGDVGVDATGTYGLTIANVPRAFSVPGGDQGGTIGGAPAIGAITLGDVDMWTFLAHEGDNLTVVISETGVTNDFTPWIRLKSPTGAQADSAFGTTTATIIATANETGIYTILVSTGDTGLEGTGNYTMNLAGNSTNMIKNGNFDQGETSWQFFGAPTQAHIVHQVTAGVLEYYRVPPPPDTLGQAIAFQHTGVAIPVAGPLGAQFDLGNSSTTRKRISVLMLDASFSDLRVCTFYLEPGAPMRTYAMRTFTTLAWSNAALYFYAASAGSDNGFYQLDNVSMSFVPDGPKDRTDCVDPTTPAPPGGVDSGNLIGNGDFGTGTLSPWFNAFAITFNITGGVLQFTKPDNTPPSGVIGQSLGQAMAEGEHITATFQLGNSSAVRKRITVLINNDTFSDLSACTFWLEAGQPLATFAYRAVTKKPWANTMIHFYPATAGFEWFQVDNVTFQRTPNANIVGNECIEPGPGGDAIGEEARSAPVEPRVEQQDASVAAAAASGSNDAAPLEIIAPGAGKYVLAIGDAIDLRDTTTPQLAVDSWLTGAVSNGEVQVSVDGETWVTVATASASADWMQLTTDLTAFAGQVVRVRFVLDARQPSESEEPASWKIRSLRVVK